MEEGPAAFAALLTALAERGQRAGWLELGGQAPAPLPPSLAAAAGAGVLRAVAVGGGRVVSVKPVTGRPVMQDLAREHFRGCLVVLVRGAGELARLAPEDDGWRLTRRDGGSLRWSTAELVSALGRPSRWR